MGSEVLRQITLKVPQTAAEACAQLLSMGFDGYIQQSSATTYTYLPSPGTLLMPERYQFILSRPPEGEP